MWGWGWGLSCFLSNTSEDGWPIQFSSRQLNLANSYYWVFIMLYWACHKVGEDKASALKDYCLNLTCHLLASCCLGTDGSESQCHWCPDFRNCPVPLIPNLVSQLPPLQVFAQTVPEFATFIIMGKELCNDWILSRTFPPTPHCYVPLAFGRWAISIQDYIYSRSYSRSRREAEISIPSFSSWLAIEQVLIFSYISKDNSSQLIEFCDSLCY